MKQYIGADPGKTGALVMIEGSEVVKLTYPLIGKEYDVRGILDIFRVFDRDNCHIVIEDVKALQKPFQSGNWSLAEGKTILIMCCVALDLPFTLVHSKTWQKEIWQGVPVQKKSKGRDKKGVMKYETLTKETTLIAVKRLFPIIDLREDKEPVFYKDTPENRKSGKSNKEVPRRDKNAHDGIVDALAMAEYCRRKFK